MTESGFYIVSDKFFNRFHNIDLKGNKKENRPFYYAFKDKKTGLFWLVPMSSRIEKYKAIVIKRERNNKPCDIIHIAKLDNGRESVFLIQDMFPITEEYVLREYTIAENHFRVTSESLAKVINKKAKHVLEMIKKGIKFTPDSPDVLLLESKLIKELNE